MALTPDRIQNPLLRGTRAGIEEDIALASAAKGLVTDNEKDMQDYQRRMQKVSDEFGPSKGAEDLVTAIHSPGTFVDWSLYTLGKLIPSAIPSLALGGVGGFAAKEMLGAGLKTAAKTALKSKVKSEAEKRLLKDVGKKIATGAAVGSRVGNIGMETASIGGDIYSETGKIDPLRSLAFGIPAGLLDSLPETRFAHGLLKPAKLTPGGVLREAGKQALTEGATESLQGVIETAGVEHAKGRDITSPEALHEIFNPRQRLEEFAAGALGGGVLGGGGHGIKTLMTGGKENAKHDKETTQVHGVVQAPEESPGQVSAEGSGERVYAPGAKETQEKIKELEEIHPSLSGKTKDIVEERLVQLRMQAAQANALGLPSEEPLTGFYSPVHRAVKELPQEKGSGEQMFKMLQKRKGVKQEELDDLGLKEYLQDRPSVTKAEITDFVEKGGAKLQVRTFEDKVTPQLVMERAKDILKKEKGLEGTEINDSDLTQYFTLKELDYASNVARAKLTMELDAVKHGEPDLRMSGPQENYREVLLTVPPHPDKRNYSEVFHFDGTPNIVASARATDRVDTSGANITLVDEVQGDLHQKARASQQEAIKNLTARGVPLEEARKQVPLSAAYDSQTDAEVAEFRSLMEKPKDERVMADYIRLYGFKRKLSVVPNAPFKKSWPLLMMKKMLKDAAVNGKDKLAWTTGEQQNKRWGDEPIISKEVVIQKNKSGKIDTLQFLTVSGDMVFGKIDWETGQMSLGNPPWHNVPLAKFIPANLIEQLRQGNIEGTVGIPTVNFQTTEGGGVFANFYDKEIRNDLSGYLKQFGAEVGKTTIKTDTGEEEVHAVEITPKLRAAMFDDVALYSEGHDPTGDIKTANDNLIKAFGLKAVLKLKSSGILQVLNPTDFAAATGQNPLTTKGYFLDGKIYLNSAFGNRATAVLLHEGTHSNIRGTARSGLRMLLGNSYLSIQRQFDTMVRAGDKLAVQAAARANMARTNREGKITHEPTLNEIEMQERLAYYTELSAAQNTPLYQRIISAFKAWFRQSEFGQLLARMGIAPTLDPATMVELAKLAVKRTQQVQKIFANYEILAKGEKGLASEIIEARADMDKQQMATMLGQVFYGDMPQLPYTMVKELFQNSVDAVRAALEFGHITDAKVDITVNAQTREITIVDNGVGMNKEILTGPFLTIGGSFKEGRIHTGGYGVAKAAIIYAPDTVRVESVRDGMKMTLDSTGVEIYNSLNEEGKKLNFIRDEAPGVPNGTKIVLKVPATYFDARNEVNRGIYVPDRTDLIGRYFAALKHSPLFADIAVTVNGEVVPVGKNFPKDDYGIYNRIEIPGTGYADIFVEKNEHELPYYDQNTHILVNGIWQLDQGLKVNPFKHNAPNIPRNIYINITTERKPESPLYPVNMQRQGLRPMFEKAFEFVFKELQLKALAGESLKHTKSFGNLRTLEKDGSIGGEINIVPKIDKEALAGKTLDVNAKDNYVIADEKLYRSQEDYEAGIPVEPIGERTLVGLYVDMDDYRVPQSKFAPNTLLLHDNVTILADDEVEEMRQKADKIREQFLPETWNTLSDAEKSAVIRASTAAENELAALSNVGGQRKRLPLTEVAQKKFGSRFNNFALQTSRAFRDLRDIMSLSGLTGYGDIQELPVGVMFSYKDDSQLFGVHVLRPFRGMLVDPGLSAGADVVRWQAQNTGDFEHVGLSLYYTMVHEIAHHVETSDSSHGPFALEFQRVLEVLDLTYPSTVQKIKKGLMKLFTENADIFTYLKEARENVSSYRPESIGDRLRGTYSTPRGTEDFRGDRTEVSEAGREPGVGEGSEASVGGLASAIPISREEADILNSAGVYHFRKAINGPDTTGNEGWFLPSEQLTRKRARPLPDDVQAVLDKIGERTGGALGSGLATQDFTGDMEYVPPEEGFLDLGRTRTWRDWKNYASYHIHDRFRYLYERQKELGPQPDFMDPYLAETRSHGIIADRVEKLDKSFVDPILKIIGDNGLKMERVQEFLHARHAPEANERLRRINAKRFLLTFLREMRGDQRRRVRHEMMAIRRNAGEEGPLATSRAYYDLLEREVDHFHPEARDLWNNFKKQPSGMTDVRADVVLRGIPEDSPLWQLGELFDAMNRQSIITRQQAGLMTEAEALALLNAYEHWAPLKRTGYDDTVQGSGQGVSLGGREFMVRAGSSKPVVNILENAVIGARISIVRAERAKIGEALYNLVAGNRDPSFWTVDHVKPRPRLMADGSIQNYPDMKVGNNEIMVKIDGEAHRIWFAPDNPNAYRIAYALKNHETSVGPIIGGLMVLNRWLSWFNTTANPEFWFTNTIKDFGTAQFNMTGTEASQFRVQVVKDMPGAMRGILSALRGWEGNEWTEWFKDMKANGGTAGWIDNYSDASKVKEKLGYRMKRIKHGTPLNVAHTIMQGVEDVSMTTENAIRLAVYRRLVESGVSKARAAQAAKELTVNFNRHGTWGPGINALYLFSNASIQGSAAILRAASHSSTLRKAMVATIGVSFAVSLANRAIGKGDDDDKSKYDNIEFWKRERNIIIMQPGGGYFKIPLPWGYNILWVIGDQLASAFSHITGDNPDYKPLDSATSTILAALNAFGPIQGGTLAQTVLPTVFDPVVMMSENKTFTGAPLKPENNPWLNVPAPEHQLYWDSVSKSSVAVTKALSDLTGGDEVEGGLIDFSPEYIDFAVNTGLGAMGKFFYDTFNLAIGDVKESRDIPFFRKVYGDPSKSIDLQNYRDNVQKVFLMDRKYKELWKEPGIKEKTLPYRRLLSYAKGTEKYVKQLYQAKKRAKTEERKEQLQERIERLMEKFNNRYRKALM